MTPHVFLLFLPCLSFVGKLLKREVSPDHVVSGIDAAIASNARDIEKLAANLKTLDAQLADAGAARIPLAVPAKVHGDADAESALRVLNARLRDLDDQRSITVEAQRQLQDRARELETQKAAALLNAKWSELADLDADEVRVCAEADAAFEAAAGKLSEIIRLKIAKAALADDLGVPVGREWLGMVEDVLSHFLLPPVATRGQTNAAYIATPLHLDHSSAIRKLSWSRTATAMAARRQRDDVAGEAKEGTHGT